MGVWFVQRHSQPADPALALASPSASNDLQAPTPAASANPTNSAAPISSVPAKIAPTPTPTTAPTTTPAQPKQPVTEATPTPRSDGLKPGTYNIIVDGALAGKLHLRATGGDGGTVRAEFNGAQATSSSRTLLFTAASYGGKTAKWIFGEFETGSKQYHVKTYWCESARACVYYKPNVAQLVAS